MNIPQLKPYEEVAVDTVIAVINQAKDKLGVRQNLVQLANTAAYAWADIKLSTKSIVPPYIKSAEKFIAKTIETHWNLTKVFMYFLKYMGDSEDEVSHYYYFEAIFSQPTATYPIPQATVSVFFRVADKLLKKERGVPRMFFRIEGHHTDHDVRYVRLVPEWLLAVIKMKINFFKRIETIRLF